MKLTYSSQTTANSLSKSDKRIDNLDELIDMILKDRYQASRAETDNTN